MRSLFAIATILGAAAAQTSPHAAHLEIIDQSSTKEYGLVKWQYFFDLYVLNQVISAPIVFDGDDHLCWFKFTVEQWNADVDDRYAFTLSQNCPASMIDNFTFSITMKSPNNKILYDKSTPAGNVAITSDTNVVFSSVELKNAVAPASTTNNYFGILSAVAYADKTAAEADYSYSYTYAYPASG